METSAISPQLQNIYQALSHLNISDLEKVMQQIINIRK